MVTPCGHLLCVECTSEDSRHCTHCHIPYVMQAIQDPARKKDNLNPQWEVPFQLIECQPAYTQIGATGEGEGEWQVKWMKTKTTKCDCLLTRLRELGAIPSRNNISGQNILEGLAAGCEAGQQADEEYIDMELANNYNRPSGSNPTIRDNSHPALSKERKETEEQPPPKVIVFTQFWAHMLLLEQFLTSSGVSFALYRKQLPQREKNNELKRFQSGHTCNILLMDESGALGLDLSCVSHIFLMEPMINASLQDQVVSRACEVDPRIGDIEESKGGWRQWRWCRGRG